MKASNQGGDIILGMLVQKLRNVLSSKPPTLSLFPCRPFRNDCCHWSPFRAAKWHIWRIYGAFFQMGRRSHRSPDGAFYQEPILRSTPFAFKLDNTFFRQPIEISSGCTLRACDNTLILRISCAPVKLVLKSFRNFFYHPLKASD